MTTPRWRPATEVTKAEEFLLKRLTRTKKLFGFLREVRSELFSDEFQAELEAMYRGTGAGRIRKPPALMARYCRRMRARRMRRQWSWTVR
ncbi:MAG: hypothetical protein KIT72_16690 [Polyangiaceae bacterium]|nr:hypothetical protein [Polyangiaceae bacterium]